jgi:isopenicillin-N epimerase
VDTARTSRRRFLKAFGYAGAMSTAWAAPSQDAHALLRPGRDQPVTPNTSWADFRGLFELRPDRIHMSGMVIASHPAPVSRAIDVHRAELQKDPVRYIDENRWRLEGETLRAASHYFDAAAGDIALTDSTSMGLSLLYTGLRVDQRHEILTTTHDHYSTETALAECAERTGCSVRRVPMYRDLATATADELVDAIRLGISDKTRIVAMTWVHSGTGLKVPVRRIGEAIQQLNAARDEEHRVYLCVDGVHALGIENFTLPELNCDFWAAGTHKWLFGPRGTGVLWGRANAWKMTRPTVATWEPAEFQAGIGWKAKSAIGGGQLMTPGGYHSFDHRWALGSAFDLHEKLGKARVQERIHHLNTQLKEGLRKIKGVRLYTPISEALSSGIVCFDVGSLPPQTVVDRLFEKNIVASRTPYKSSYARLCPSLLTLESDVEATLNAVATLAG